MRRISRQWAGRKEHGLDIGDSTSKNKTNLTKPNLFITSKLLVFHAYAAYQALSNTLFL